MTPLGPTPDSRPGVSGRRLLLSLFVLLLALSSVVAFFFARWRADTQRRLDLARQIVLPALDPLEHSVPPGVDPADWSLALDSTRSMLLEVLSHTRLDRPALESLRADLDSRFSSLPPDRALSVLWDHMSLLSGRLPPRLSSRRPALARSPSPDPVP